MRRFVLIFLFLADAAFAEDTPVGAPTAATQPAMAIESHTAGSGPTDAACEASTKNWLGLPAAPLTEPIVTDRPDFTESTETVPYGHIQLEMGYTFTYDHEDGVRTGGHTAPEALLRLGLIEHLEARIGWEGYTWSQTRQRVERSRGRTELDQEWEQGASDLYLGAKTEILEQDGLIPNFSVITAITVPTGSAGFSSGDVDPEVVWCWGYDFTDRLSLTGNIGTGVPTGESGRFFQTTGSLSLGYELKEKLGSYIEYYGLYPADRPGSCAHTIDGGLTYKITDNFQIDWRVGRGLNEQADDFFTGVGFAIRY
jgi:hypothetical protein